ncbi:chondroitin AC/alginate lyase [Acrodontium crateriforme]|uniref:Chondroitin AC/alginate lyase n=1 Tax=Acrodontium crateriforme TaxID=150365 RepID=A0AAQ3LZW4_9PEZI|nr:chondroitin AC/alginate lyase [Acrodontium crateriforme]
MFWSIRRPVALIALITAFANATGPLYGLPVLNGPVIGTTQVPGAKSGPGDFIHPGLWHTHDDLERMRLGVSNQTEPYYTAFQAFSNDSYSQSSYQIQGPYSVLCRGQCSNYTSFSNDVRAAYQNAIMWYITRDDDHWNRSTTILDAWGTSLSDIHGTDTSLLVGLEGDLFANAGEIMRWEGNWTESTAAAGGSAGFSNQLYWLFARQSIIVGQANYGMISIKALLSFAVYLDDISMWNYAINLYQNDLCAGLYGNLQPGSGQSSETGRDQGHAQGGLGWAAEASRVMQSQGFDAYSLGNNLLLAGGEYAAQYNLGNDVPYDPKFYRCEAILVNGPWSEPSPISRGVTTTTPYVYDILYYQYVVKRGLSAPYITQMKQQLDNLTGGEGHTHITNSLDDHPGWGDLIWSYPSSGQYANNNNQTIWGAAKKVKSRTGLSL